MRFDRSPVTEFIPPIEPLIFFSSIKGKRSLSFRLKKCQVSLFRMYRVQFPLAHGIHSAIQFRFLRFYFWGREGGVTFYETIKIVSSITFPRLISLARLFSAIKINPFPFRIDQILLAMLIVSQNSTGMIIIQF